MRVVSRTVERHRDTTFDKERHAAIAPLVRNDAEGTRRADEEPSGAVASVGRGRGPRRRQEAALAVAREPHRTAARPPRSPPPPVPGSPRLLERRDTAARHDGRRVARVAERSADRRGQRHVAAERPARVGEDRRHTLVARLARVRVDRLTDLRLLRVLEAAALRDREIVDTAFGELDSEPPGVVDTAAALNDLVAEVSNADRVVGANARAQRSYLSVGDKSLLFDTLAPGPSYSAGGCGAGWRQAVAWCMLLPNGARRIPDLSPFRRAPAGRPT